MWKNVPYKNYTFTALGINFAVFIYIILTKKVLPPVVPFFYGLPSGQNQLISTNLFIFSPLIGSVVLLTNIFLAKTIKDLFLKKALVISGIFIVLLFSIAALKIVFLVGSF